MLGISTSAQQTTAMSSSDRSMEEVGIPELATALNQTEGQVRRYYDAGVYHVHRFGGANGQAKLTYKGSAQARLRTKGLLERRLQKSVPLKTLGSYLKATCQLDDKYIVCALENGDEPDIIAERLAQQIYDKYYNIS